MLNKIRELHGSPSATDTLFSSIGLAFSITSTYVLSSRMLGFSVTLNSCFALFLAVSCMGAAYYAFAKAKISDVAKASIFAEIVISIVLLRAIA